MTQINTRFIEDAAVTKAKLNTDVASPSVSGGGGAALAVIPDTTGGANLAEVVDVNANGVAIRIDDTTLEVNGSNQLQVKASAINAQFVEEITLSGADITAKKATLGATPAATTLCMCAVGGVTQIRVADFVITIGPDEIDWNGLGLDGVLIAGDVLILTYPI